MDKQLANDILSYFSNQNSFSPLAIINHEFPQKPIHEVLAEIERLNLVTTKNSGPQISYLLKSPIKEQIKSLPIEFIGKPYEYFLDVEQKELREAKMEKWYNRQDAKQRFDDYPKVVNEKRWAIGISIAAIIVTTVIAIATKGKC